MLGSCRMIFSLSKKETGIKKRQRKEVGRDRKGRRQPAHHGSPSRTITLDPRTSTCHFAVTQIFSSYHPKHSCLGIHLPGFYYHLHPSICSCSYVLAYGMPSVLQSKTRWFGWCYSNLVQTKGLQCALCLPGPWRASYTGISPLHSDSVLLLCTPWQNDWSLLHALVPPPFSSDIKCPQEQRGDHCLSYSMTHKFSCDNTDSLGLSNPHHLLYIPLSSLPTQFRADLPIQGPLSVSEGST